MIILLIISSFIYNVECSFIKVGCVLPYLTEDIVDTSLLEDVRHQIWKSNFKWGWVEKKTEEILLEIP